MGGSVLSSGSLGAERLPTTSDTGTLPALSTAPTPFPVAHAGPGAEEISGSTGQWRTVWLERCPLRTERGPQATGQGLGGGRQGPWQSLLSQTAIQPWASSGHSVGLSQGSTARGGVGGGLRVCRNTPRLRASSTLWGAQSLAQTAWACLHLGPILLSRDAGKQTSVHGEERGPPGELFPEGSELLNVKH